jgi:DNA-binding CsgD family transcriptional regulator
MALLWDSSQIETAGAAIEAARAGRPTLIAVLGEPGMGKTSLLREIARRASGFNVLPAEGSQRGYQEPFGVLRYLGVDDVLTPAGVPKDPLVATQGLRDLVDSLSPSGPVLILVDDLQWVDPETIESLFWLLDRAHGDRLLIAVASRPESAGHTNAWRRLVHRASRGPGVRLTGLSLGQAKTMIAELDQSFDPDVDEAVAGRLWEHTGGNPFYLQSLLRQYGLAELAVMRTLPAPAELTDRMKAELAALPDDAVALIQASAVLGSSWQDGPTLAAVGEVEDVGAALQALVDAGLLALRLPETMSPVRCSHDLVRAAIYQAIPFQRRRELHLRAAERVANAMDALEHRVAATDHYDDALAAQLERESARVHAAGSFRQSAQLLRWSSGLTEDAAPRNRRWLDAAVDLVLARDIAAVRQQLPAIRSAPDTARAAVIVGLLHGVEKRWVDALTAVASVRDEAVDRADPVTRYRLLVLMAWSMICAGRDLENLGPLLSRAAAEPAHDPALIGNEIFALGMLRFRRRDGESLAETVSSIPVDSSTTPMQLTYKLAWRGSVHAFWGHAERAEADLVEATARIRSGVADNGDGVYNGLLAFTRWQRGAWNLAKIDMGIALDSAIGQPHPMNRAIQPMLLAVVGDFEQADKLLQQAGNVLEAMPWREPCHLYVISYVVRQHAGGDTDAQGAALDHLRNVLGSQILDVPGFTGAVWAFHLALAAAWAREIDLAERFVGECEAQPLPPRWMAWVPSWLRGSIAQAAGSLDQARTSFDAAVAAFSDELPLYRAHTLADRARLAQLQGDHETAEQSMTQARRIYRVLGAVPYLDRTTTEHGYGCGPDVLAPLSDRERDVATLLISGLTYAQIARDLFVTRATVGFHTSRIYAKTGVASRAELIDLVRAAAEN